MKTNGRIGELLGTPCLNDYEYGHRVIWPLLDYLGVPSQARRPQFQIENPFGEGLLRLDFLIHHGDVPLVTIEGEPTARQFDQGFRQAKNYSRNFKPRQRGCLMQERTVPFLITAAGNRAEMCRAVVRGLNIEYETIRQGGVPAFLEWEELLAEAGQARPEAVVSRQQQVLVAELANQFFTELFGSIDRVAALRNKDDQKIILFNRIIDRTGRTASGWCAGNSAWITGQPVACSRPLRYIGRRSRHASSLALQSRVAIGLSCFSQVAAARIVFSRASRRRALIRSTGRCGIGMPRGISRPLRSASRWSGWRIPAPVSG